MSKRIIFRNFDDDQNSHMRNDNTADRVYQFPDRDITVAGTDDIFEVTTVSITEAATLTDSAYGKLHVCSGTSAGYTVDLPTAAGHAGESIAFKGLVGLTVTVTLDGATTETIDGDTTRSFTSRGIYVLQSDGTNWIITHEVGSWISWTPTFTGFSADPTNVDARYFRTGNKIDIRISMTGGTSNATTFTMTLPFNALAVYHYSLLLFNSGASVSGRGSMAAGSNVLTMFATGAGGAWTASGIKAAPISLTYEKA